MESIIEEVQNKIIDMKATKEEKFTFLVNSMKDGGSFKL